VILLLAGVLVLSALAALTSVGQRRRGDGLVLAIVAGMFFPITWAVWYIHDEHPYRLTHRH
jgi:hypothetical protein